LARRPVIELVGAVVDEQVVLDHVLLVGRVRQRRSGHRTDGGRRESAEHELRPALGVAHVNRADQDPGDGADQTGDARGGRARLLGLYSRSHQKRRAVFQCCNESHGNVADLW